jgi:hypothetical protein
LSRLRVDGSSYPAGFCLEGPLFVVKTKPLSKLWHFSLKLSFGETDDRLNNVLQRLSDRIILSTIARPLSRDEQNRPVLFPKDDVEIQQVVSVCTWAAQVRAQFGIALKPGTQNVWLPCVIRLQQRRKTSLQQHLSAIKLVISA